MDIKKVKKIFELIKETSFNEVEIKEEGLRIKVIKISNIPIQVPTQTNVVPAQTPTAPAESSTEKENENHFVVKTPLVGTLYLAPSPEADVFVEVGNTVKRGQVLCIVEAMKLMNQIESEVDGIVEKILIKNAQPVEYGQPIIIINTNRKPKGEKK
jgi:acetyl-CoA carboxylase biotin carboxyl carrier protein